MKKVLRYVLSVLTLNVVAATHVTFEPNEAAQCFKNIVEAFGEIAVDAKNQDVLETCVAKMISSMMDMMTIARDCGITISKEECSKIFADLNESSRSELEKMLAEEKEVKRSEDCCNDECKDQACEEATKSCCKDKCSCKDKCNSCSPCSSCCKSVTTCCDETGCSVDTMACDKEDCEKKAECAC